MTIRTVQNQPVQPTICEVRNHSDQARRVAVLALGILTSAVILATIQPPASIIYASVVMLVTISIAFDSGDRPASRSITEERTIYVVKERPNLFWSVWNLPYGPRSDRVPVGTGQRNSFHDVQRGRGETSHRETTSEPTSWNREPVGTRESSSLRGSFERGPQLIIPKENPFEPVTHTNTDRVPVGRR